MAPKVYPFRQRLLIAVELRSRVLGFNFIVFDESIQLGTKMIIREGSIVHREREREKEENKSARSIYHGFWFEQELHLPVTVTTEGDDDEQLVAKDRSFKVFKNMQS